MRAIGGIPISADVDRPTLENINRLTHERLKNYLERTWASNSLSGHWCLP
jgi:hypothetical protein